VTQGRTGSTMAAELEVCDVGGPQGYFVPIGGDGEARWPSSLKVVLYLVGLLWSFMGVAIISDTFMGAIECVTSAKKRLKLKNGQVRTVKVWNDTVSNLTLMALGSSAPEILLSCIEIVGGGFMVGPLGPSTIVGSAAFNMLVIIAVCVSSIPDGETRRIKDMNVFSVTASFSVFAYLWLLFILELNTKDIVEPWEAFVTFALFPVFIVIAYLADIGALSIGMSSKSSGDIVLSQASMEEFAQLERQVRQDHGEHLTETEVAALMQYLYAAPTSRAEHRVNATRKMFKGRKVLSKDAEQDKSLRKELATKLVSDAAVNRRDGNEAKTETFLSFAYSDYQVLESVGKVKFHVKREGDLATYVSVGYQTCDGTAEKGKDYEQQAGYLEFQPGEKEKAFDIRIIDDNAFELAEEFYIDLKEPVVLSGTGQAKFGAITRATIIIIDDDLPGKLSFEKEEVTIEDDDNNQTLIVTVKRSDGATGRIGCKYFTESGTAVAGKDFIHTEGEVEFENGQMTASFEVVIQPKGRYETTETLRVYLKDPTGGATFDRHSDGGEDECVLTVIIQASQKTKDRVARVMQTINWDQVQVGHARWKDQWIAAMYCGGSKEDQDDASILDWIMHVICLPWKILFALVPPTEYANGWVSFCSCLIMIGLATTLISDLANLLGCALDLKPSITAVTFVAMGTSLPDTFASKMAAVQDKYADASIGNVTGSNSVNVFLGIGLPWLLAALRWKFWGISPGWIEKYSGYRELCPDACFIVPAGGLAFSVAVFSSLAVVCIFTLMLRRNFAGGELGGAKWLKYGTSLFLFALWALFIGLYIWFEG